jgi:glycosyltransferase involved in cell wall biosynthesis
MRVMNITYITNVRIPTSRAQGYAVMKMCEQFAGQGARVELIVPNRRNNESESDPYKYYGIKRNFSIRKIASIDLLGPFEAFGKLFYWIDMLSFLISLRFNGMGKKDSIIYTRDYLVATIAPSKRFVCLEIHDIPAQSFLFSRALKKARCIFVLNKYLKEELVSRGSDEKKIFISPSGVDISFFNNGISQEEARRNLSLPLDKKIAVYAGHFYTWKGVDVLAQAAILLPEALFVFVGGVDPEYSRFKKAYQRSSNIMAFSYVERARMPFYMKAADVLVLPNTADSDISSKYTSPLKLFEYMASGRPVVASDLPSVREAVSSDCVTLVAPDDPEALAAAIRNVIDGNGSDRVRCALREVQRYDWSVRANDILRIMNLSSSE